MTVTLEGMIKAKSEFEKMIRDMFYGELVTCELMLKVNTHIKRYLRERFPNLELNYTLEDRENGTISVIPKNIDTALACLGVDPRSDKIKRISDEEVDLGHVVLSIDEKGVFLKPKKACENITITLFEYKGEIR